MLTAGELLILTMREYGFKIKEIASGLKISRERVRQLEAKARRKLRGGKKIMNERGASSIEYAFLVVLIAVAIIAGLSVFGSVVKSLLEVAAAILPK